MKLKGKRKTEGTRKSKILRRRRKNEEKIDTRGINELR